MCHRYDDVFEESMAKFYTAEMVLAIHSVHLMGYVHRSVGANPTVGSTSKAEYGYYIL